MEKHFYAFGKIEKRQLQQRKQRPERQKKDNLNIQIAHLDR